MIHPRISIVTVTYNAGSVVEKTLRSVAEQNYDNLEYIVVDGASKDDTLEVVGRYRDRVDILISEPDRGLYDAMNKGAAAATGEWLLYLNADDVFVDPQVVADVATFIETHPEAEVVYGNTEQIWDFGTRIDIPTQHYRNHKMCISPQATFVLTRLHLSHPFNLKYHYAADFEQSTNFVLEGRSFEHIDRIISRIELREGVTHDNHLASEAEIYDILLEQGFDVEFEKRRKLRNIRIVTTFKRIMPNWIVKPVMRGIAKYYKPM